MLFTAGHGRAWRWRRSCGSSTSIACERWTKPFVIYGVNPIVAFVGSAVMARCIYSIFKVNYARRSGSRCRRWIYRTLVRLVARRRSTRRSRSPSPSCCSGTDRARTCCTGAESSSRCDVALCPLVEPIVESRVRPCASLVPIRHARFPTLERELPPPSSQCSSSLLARALARARHHVRRRTPCSRRRAERAGRAARRCRGRRVAQRQPLTRANEGAAQAHRATPARGRVAAPAASTAWTSPRGAAGLASDLAA